ncbi:ACT domain-containing protein, partial [Auritidibacter ignavus]|uniref:ACT domain-containing protein n=2 Tax=Micrococcaceae TaxID=1268 RepID=UPI00109D27C6
PLEQPIIAGIAHDRSEGKVTVIGVPDVPGKAAEVFHVVAKTNTNIDMIVQNVSRAGSGRTDISFTIPKDQGDEALRALREAQEDIGFEDTLFNKNIGKVSLVGGGMRSNPGISARFFDALHNAGANIDLISTSEIRISVITAAEKLDDAIKAIHTEFDLDAEEEATVYAGTGR